ncbi:hypothetical protein SUGI_0222090 [Cryptomeria japonica]|nr:hypothetical protein SUGI_0222090 [Cryptomeria japonica]
MTKYGSLNTELLDKQLDDFLNSCNVKATKDMKVKRAQIIAQLSEIVKRWIKGVALACGSSDPEPNANIFPFGSYVFDVYGPESDIDVLCVGPSYARESDFFETLHKILAEMPNASQIQKIPQAYVPIIKFKFDEIAIDMVYACVGLHTIPQDLDLLNIDSLMKENILDKKTMLSINGYRNTEKIKQIMNQNMENFCIALHSLKLWARNRIVYSNASGFLGGINLALLLCLVCLHNPDASASWLLWKFFTIYSDWTWPSPVKISNEFFSITPHYGGEWEWDPVHNNKNDAVPKIDLMPMITPATPHRSNAANNVCASSLAIMKQEFKIAKATCQVCSLLHSTPIS